MNDGVFRNPEFQRVLALFLLLVSLLVAAVLSANYILWVDVARELTTRDVAIIGAVLAKYPKEESRLLAAMKGDYSSADIEAGLGFASKYGYGIDSPLVQSPLVARLHGESVIWFLAILGSWFAAMLVFFLLVGRGFYGRIRDLSLAAESVMNGQFDVVLPDEGEGEFALLSYQMNQMAKRLKMSFERLEAERELLRRMISDISHQVKTPLSSLRAFVELLLDEPDVERRQEFLKTSLAQIDRMERLIHTLLKIARLESGVILFKRNTEDLVESLQRAVDSVKFHILEKGQRLKWEKPQAPVIFPHDEQWVEEAFTNFLKNAVDYTPEGGEIRISVQDTAEMVRIMIADTGTGISDEDLPHIFERFYEGKHRGDTSHGSGIGLSLAKLVIDRHGGMVKVESKLGVGTTFTISFIKSL